MLRVSQPGNGREQEVRCTPQPRALTPSSGNPCCPSHPSGKAPTYGPALEGLGVEMAELHVGQGGGAGTGPGPHAGIHAGDPLQHPEDTAVTLERVPTEVPGQEAGEGLRPGLHHLEATPHPLPGQSSGWSPRAYRKRAQISAPSSHIPPPCPAPLSLTHESGSPGLGTGIWEGSQDGYWPGSWWKERKRRSHQQL